VAPRAQRLVAPADSCGANRRFGSGALLTVTRDAYLDVGGFDERYFLYGEDLDLWHRLRIAGRACCFAPDVVADHAEKGGSEMSATRRELMRKLGVELFVELHGRSPWQAYRLVHRIARSRLRETGDLGTLVAERWRRGDRPSSVLAAVREQFEQPAFPLR
jgi:GT2 family glycosyltransferase